ncbi:hypothetical protein [Paraburkholderia youngii]|uniref:hypothetical protein n=1 Tax=Paraburkholderia youngii TaxID=2782701 RepID=UPI001590D6A3|nr:hypothetical protein [Paraburkholderia youngii]NUX58671.1 hypothetical protein [Paraburkholderia youngii]
MTVRPELAEELRKMAAIKAEERRWKAMRDEFATMWRRLNKLNEEYHRAESTHAEGEALVKESKRRMGELVDEIYPLRLAVDEREKELRRLWHKIEREKKALQ